MRHAVISVTLVCVVALLGIQQVDGHEDQEEENLPTVIMMNQLGIIESTQGLKAVLNMTLDGQQRQCDTREELVSMRNTLEKSEAHQAELLNSSIVALSALSDVPSTLQAIAQAAETYTPTTCDETKEVTSRLDRLISTINESSASTARAIFALQMNTLEMMEVLKKSLKLQSDIYDHMKNESDKAPDCCNGIQHQIGNLTQVVTTIKELKSCRDGIPCPLKDNKNGLLRPCDKQDRPKRHTSSSCPLCCYEDLGTTGPGFLKAPPTVTIDVDVVEITERPCSNREYTCSDGQCVSFYARCNGHPDCVDGSDERDCPPKRECCPGNFMDVISRDGPECFYISRRLKSWFNARRTCEDMGGYIAKPSDSDSLAKYIRDNYENKRWYWIERSNLDNISRTAEKTVSVIEHNCHVLDAGQEDNQPNLQPSACSGIWYFICQIVINDECASLKTIGT